MCKKNCDVILEGNLVNIATRKVFKNNNVIDGKSIYVPMGIIAIIIRIFDKTALILTSMGLVYVKLKNVTRIRLHKSNRVSRHRQ